MLHMNGLRQIRTAINNKPLSNNNFIIEIHVYVTKPHSAFSVRVMYACIPTRQTSQSNIQFQNTVLEFSSFNKSVRKQAQHWIYPWYVTQILLQVHIWDQQFNGQHLLPYGQVERPRLEFCSLVYHCPARKVTKHNWDKIHLCFWQ